MRDPIFERGQYVAACAIIAATLFGVVLLMSWTLPAWWSHLQALQSNSPVGWDLPRLAMARPPHSHSHEHMHFLLSAAVR